jgi:hypothetical protein
LDRKHPLIEYYTKKNVNQHEPVPFMEEKAGMDLGSKSDFRYF